MANNQRLVPDKKRLHHNHHCALETEYHDSHEWQRSEPHLYDLDL